VRIGLTMRDPLKWDQQGWKLVLAQLLRKKPLEKA